MGEAAKQNVGIGPNQIPDMSAFAADLRATGIQRLPSGLMIQWGSGRPDITGGSTVNYPVAFSLRPFFVGFGYRQSNYPTTMQSIILNDQIVNNIGFQARCLQNDGSGMTAGQSAFFWFALGK